MPLSEEQVLKMKQKRETILQQAILLFAERGYDDTTIAKVAKASGVSFGSVFTYFENKDQLFHAAVTEPLQEHSVKLLDFDPQASELLLELERMVTNHIKMFAAFDLYLRLVVQVVGYYNRFPYSFAELDAFHNIFREKIAELLVNGQQKGLLHVQDPKYVATAYMSLLIGLRVNLTDEPQSNMWEKFVPVAMQLFGPKNS
ncbi:MULTISPECIES: TetR/AcrR family transcriptional regulator [Brevibacillus]|uniref:Probable transcriptional regulator n=1 Tax=Brevibacillus brevis (strain 47 / JCM 6285 / NBRC 100599) TaxID=358681 RepID=C0ZI69_BREBN|nr:TetR/AcrR family transcriptional regulator [Brevibacillus brevis]MBH0330483.1 transcriptional regulator [Brevibacillus brevis]BAH45343.1 probable transcriptional regulator [Brevibacillus brevis NBRC 100599]